MMSCGLKLAMDSGGLSSSPPSTIRLEALLRIDYPQSDLRVDVVLVFIKVSLDS